MLLTSERIQMILVTVVLESAQMYTFLRLSMMRYDRKKSNIAAVIVLVLTLSACIISCIQTGGSRETGISLLTLTLPNLVFFFIISRYRGIKFIVTYCISDISIACMDFLLYLITLLAFDGNPYAGMIIRSAGIIVWTAAIVGVTQDWYHRALEILQRGWWLVLATGIGMYVLMAVLAACPTAIRYRREDIPSAMLVLLFIELTGFMVMRGIKRTLELQEEQAQEAQISLRLSMAQRQYELLLENVEQIKGMKHDMKHHFLMIAQLFRDNKSEELQSYLEKLAGVSDLELVPYGENYAVSVLATFFRGQAEKENIRFDCSVKVPKTIQLPTDVLTVILGNMWQNALEACGRMSQQKERYIRTHIVSREGKLIFRCENSFEGELRCGRKGVLLLSTKEDHQGQGLCNIQRLAKQYGGNCFYEQEEGKFFLTVVLLEEQTGEQLGGLRKNVSSGDM